MSLLFACGVKKIVALSAGHLTRRFGGHMSRFVVTGYRHADLLSSVENCFLGVTQPTRIGSLEADSPDTGEF